MTGCYVAANRAALSCFFTVLGAEGRSAKLEGLGKGAGKGVGNASACNSSAASMA